MDQDFRAMVKKLLAILILGVGLVSLAPCLGVLLTAGQMNAAMLVLNRALAGSSNIHLVVADRLALSQAERLLDAVLARADTRPRHELLALALLAAGDQERAVGKWIAADGYSQLLIRGDVARGADAYNDARTWYAIATRVRPDASPAWCGLGRVQVSMEAAIQLQRQALALDVAWRNPSERIGCWFEFGVRLFGMGASDEAFQAFEAVTQMGNPSDRREVSEAYRHQGLILRRNGADPEAARSLFTRALETDPANPYAVVEAALNVYLTNGDLSTTLGEFRRAMTLDPNNPNNKWIAVGIVLFLADQGLLSSAYEFCTAAPPASLAIQEFATRCRSIGGP